MVKGMDTVYGALKLGNNIKDSTNLINEREKVSGLYPQVKSTKVNIKTGNVMVLENLSIHLVRNTKVNIKMADVTVKIIAFYQMVNNTSENIIKGKDMGWVSKLNLINKLKKINGVMVK